MFETIVSLSTPPMKSALAVIRLSGDDCFDIVSNFFSKDLRNITKRTALVGKIFSKDDVVDEVVLIAYKGPHSFTGEDSVEIMCHGSTLIANEIISLAISYGARMATNGEYSSRAFMHKKIDLIQAEAINDLINATSKESKKLSLLSLSGDTSSLVTPIKTRLADILSLIEVNIDFPEYEDIEVANKETVIETSKSLIEDIDKLIQNGEKGLIIKNGIKTVIVGKPNVGKSSLLNALLGYEKAIVTDVAGTTRDVVEGDINLDGIILHLLDTAGIHDSDDKIEGIGIKKAKLLLNEAELVIVVLDGSKELEIEDKEILNITEKTNRIIVYNKIDINNDESIDKITTSALNKDIERLVKEIKKNIGIEEESFNNPSLNNVRQIALLKKAKESLLKAKIDAENDLSIDLISVSILDAYKAILEILGEENQTDLSKEIFSRFCVGK